MRIATEANARTTEAAKTSLPQALKVAFGGGTVMGLGVSGSCSSRIEFILLSIDKYVHGWWLFLWRHDYGTRIPCGLLSRC